MEPDSSSPDEPSLPGEVSLAPEPTVPKQANLVRPKVSIDARATPSQSSLGLMASAARTSSLGIEANDLQPRSRAPRPKARVLTASTQLLIVCGPRSLISRGGNSFGEVGLFGLPCSITDDSASIARAVISELFEPNKKLRLALEDSPIATRACSSVEYVDELAAVHASTTWLVHL